MPAPAPPAPTRTPRRPRLRPVIADQLRQTRAMVAGFRPARLLMIGYGLLVAVAVVLLAGVGPLAIQRLLTAVEYEVAEASAFFAALALTLLAQCALVYVIALLLSYAAAEALSPRTPGRIRLVGARDVIWTSLHRLGNATSISLVLTVAGTAIGITLLGTSLHDDTAQDSPGELAAIQLGTLLTVLTVALMYESIRICVDLLAELPALWRWTAAFVFPLGATVAIYFLLPTWTVTTRVFAQWAPREELDDLDVTGPLWDPLWALVVTAVLWTVVFVRHRIARRDAARSTR